MRAPAAIVAKSFADDSYEKDGERRRQPVLSLKVIEPSLRCATAEVRKAQRLTTAQRESRGAYDGE